MSDAIRGAACFLRGLGLLSEPGIRSFVLWPIAISVLVFAALVGVAWWQFGALLDWMLGFVPSWLQWVEWLLWIVFAAAAVLAVAFTFVLLTGLIAAPFHGPLAEAVERHLSGRGPPSVSLPRSLAKLPLDLLDELLKIAYALAVAVPFLLLFAVPLVNLVAPALWFVCCAWIAAFQFTDYAMANHGLRMRAMRRRLRGRWWLAIGFGTAAFLACLVPFVNLIAVPAAVSGGAVLWTRHLRDGAGPAGA